MTFSWMTGLGMSRNLVSSNNHDGSTAHPELVDQIAAVVLATAGVHDLHSGGAGGVATYLPGRRVHGIRAIEGGYDVYVVLAWGFPVFATAEAVRAAVQALAPGRVDVTVQDVAPAPVMTP